MTFKHGVVVVVIEADGSAAYGPLIEDENEATLAVRSARAFYPNRCRVLGLRVTEVIE